MRGQPPFAYQYPTPYQVPNSYQPPNSYPAPSQYPQPFNSYQPPNSYQSLNPYGSPSIYPSAEPYAYSERVMQNVQQVNPNDIPTVASGEKHGLSIVWILLSILILVAFAAAIVVPLAKSLKDNDRSTTTSTTSTTTTTTTTTSTTTTTTTTTTSTTTSLCGATYSQNFAGSIAASSSQCTAWNTFLAGLTCTSYNFLSLYGSNDPFGLNITNPTVVTNIVLALHSGSVYSGSSNGYNWNVGTCGGMEITATGSVCQCNTGYTIRPCIANQNWGGINGATCSASAQTLSLFVT